MEWTDAALQRLRELWLTKDSTSEIGRKLGTSKNSIVGKAHRLDLPARPSPIKRFLDGEDPNVVRGKRTQGRYPIATATLPPLPSVQDEMLPPLPAPPTEPAAAPRTMAPAVRSVAPKPIMPPPPPQAPPPKPYRKPTECCWPIGEVGTKTFQFCGEPATEGRSYCAEHHKIAHVRPYGVSHHV